MVDSKKVLSLISWYRKNGSVPDMDENFFYPILDALGDNENEIKIYLDSMNIKDLDCISGVFEDIYGKFLNDDMFAFLGMLRKKIKQYNKSIQ